jgi:hypothetical protein
MRRVRAGLWLLAFVISSSCATVAFKRNLVIKRAGFDLNCKDVIDVIDLGGRAFGATGCGRRASYVVQCLTSDASSCTAILNSDEQAADGNNAEPQPAATKTEVPTPSPEQEHESEPAPPPAAPPAAAPK